MAHATARDECQEDTLLSSGLRVAAAAACGVVLVCTSATGADAAPATVRDGDARITAALAQLRAAGMTEGGGTGSLAPAALAAQLRAGLKKAPQGAGAAAGGYNLPKCQGMYRQAAADITFQESARGGIAWKVALTKANAKLGVVNFKTQIFAEGVEVNVSPQKRKEKWNYNFHDVVARSFKEKDGGRKVTIPQGAWMSFFWTWKSAANLNNGGYRFANCAFQP
ncbi:hypothetical protein ACIHFE_31140 [Streptomyces sp. NPDC052396]|uniref:hypothetical protein n=1 Tax=Streptomyces sp. NPDC052396 TaxID=3365689 RepID=UPI0037D16446